MIESTFYLAFGFFSLVMFLTTTLFLANVKWNDKLTSFVYLVSLFCGLIAAMSLVAELAYNKDLTSMSIYDSRITLFAQLQVLGFVLGTVLTWHRRPTGRSR